MIQPPSLKAQMAAGYFINCVRDSDIQNTLRVDDVKNSTDILVQALKLERIHSINKSRRRAVTIS